VLAEIPLRREKSGRLEKWKIGKQEILNFDSYRIENWMGEMLGLSPVGVSRYV
jgi:hypothetical protein